MLRSDALYPECPECGKKDGIRKAVVTSEDEPCKFRVLRYELNCGHKYEEPGATMSEGVVELLQMTRPDVIEVDK